MIDGGSRPSFILIVAGRGLVTIGAVRGGPRLTSSCPTVSKPLRALAT